MLKYLLSLAVAFFMVTVGHGFNSTKETVTVMGITMPYRKCDVNLMAGGDKPSLVVYLHGGTSKGNDNERQLLEPGTDSIANYLAATGKPSIFLIPQCPSDKSWGGPMNNVLKAMIDRYVNAGIVDANRIYIFGGSMGGTGTWGVLSAFPGFFAAAMPVAGNPSKCVAANVCKTPVFTVMGTADVIMSVEAAQNFVEQLNALGDDVCMEIENGWTHEMTCMQSYTARRLNWVFAHDLATTSAIGGVASDSRSVVSSSYYSLTGQSVQTPCPSGVYIRRDVMSNGTIESQKVRL